MATRAGLDDGYARQFAAAHGCLRVAGVDEVGRGPLAGPVVAAAVIVGADVRNELLKLAGDSKMLSDKRKLVVDGLVRAHCIFGIGEASVAEIDMVNIRNATFLAMRRALANLGDFDGVVVDGNARIPELQQHQVAVIGGDRIELAVACASVVAKVYRDALMCRLAEEFPVYGWHSNAGYGAAVHMAALQTHGATIHHRRSFAPVREVLEKGIINKDIPHGIAA